MVNRGLKWFFVLVLEMRTTLVLPSLPLCGWLVVEATIALVARVNPLVAHSNMKEGWWADIHTPTIIVELIKDRCMIYY